METNKIRECCKSLIALCDDYDMTDDKGKLNDIEISINLEVDEINKEVI